jgi:hypothetical protein
MAQPGAVPRLWPGSPIVCLAPGPSLTSEDVAAVRAAQIPVLAISDGYQLALWSDVIYAADVAWWQRKPSACALPALKFAMPPVIQEIPDLTILGIGGESGMSDNPHVVCMGGHTGYSGINVAKHLVGSGGRIILLGYDMQPDETGRHHFFGEHPDGSHVRYHKWLDLYRSLPAILSANGISIVNATRQTAIDGIPRVALEDALQLQETT